MSRMPVLRRDQMDAEQQRVHDAILATTGRVGRGPSIGFAYSPGLWENHDAASAHHANCSLSPVQVRIVSLMTVRHWNAAYPWGAQSGSALKAGVDRPVIEAINAGEQPAFSTCSRSLIGGRPDGRRPLSPIGRRRHGYHHRSCYQNAFHGYSSL